MVDAARLAARRKPLWRDLGFAARSSRVVAARMEVVALRAKRPPWEHSRESSAVALAWVRSRKPFRATRARLVGGETTHRPLRGQRDLLAAYLRQFALEQADEVATAVVDPSGLNLLWSSCVRVCRRFTGADQLCGCIAYCVRESSTVSPIAIPAATAAAGAA